MNLLALDIGRRRTGVAFADTASRVPVSLQSLQHECDEDLFSKITALIAARRIGHLVVGLPLLPGGAEGEESHRVRKFADANFHGLLPYSFIDERYTTPKEGVSDSDSAAALAILTIFLDSGNS